jgi:plasmid stabilization system protein ParE
MMARTIVIAAHASRDVVKQARYLATYASPTVARRFQKAVADTITRLQRMPGLGSEVDFENPRTAGVQVWPVRRFEKYLLFYRAHEDTLEVLRLFHSSQDFASQFDNT